MYELAVRHMARSRMFLNPDLKIEELARSLHTNRMYLSRTINACSGRNFKQFVNWYRIGYAVDLIGRDRRLRMDEVARLSGFNNQPTFNLAFRLVMGVTPSEYVRIQMRRKRRSVRRDLSRNSAQEPGGPTPLS